MTPDPDPGSGEPRFLVARRIFWLTVFIAYAITGLRGTPAAFRHTPKAVDTGTYCGTDSLLKSALGVSGSSQKLIAIFETYPANKPMVLFWPRDYVNSSIGFQLAGYLAWPRAILSVPTDANHLEKMSDYLNTASFSARIYYLLKPPASAPGGSTVGAMKIVPVTPGKQ
ncbi:MAG: hypothetical protein WCD79_18185 [Chthoniobacteraceae bacterium]